jgi:predicted amidohydrolase YtcJ
MNLTLFTQATVYPVTSAVKYETDVLVENGKIAAMGKN